MSGIAETAQRSLGRLRVGFRPALSLGERYDRGRNSFNALRLVLSLMVLYAHSFAITGTPYRDQLYRVTGGVMTFGRLGVLAFFVVSGFLVTQSIASPRAPRLARYAWNRVLRIWPALIVSTIIVSFVVGPLFTRRTIENFYSFDGGWSPWWYTFDTLTFNAFSTLFGWHTRVRDLFAGNPMNAVVNGSLWSLRFEVAMYVALAVLAVLTRYRLRLFAAIGAGLAFGLSIGYTRLGIEVPHPDVWVLHNYDILVDMAPYFFLGSALYAFRDWIPAHGGLAALLAAAALLSTVTSVAGIVIPLAIPYVVLHAGTSRSLAWVGDRIGDYSYGTYILAFPVQQSIVAIASVTNAYVLALTAAPVTVALAAVSWHLIEAPALRLKGRPWASAAQPAASDAASAVTPTP
jgi:peptidoglycan/LPS O-acetylase OafA/YrhL